jgi:ATP-dependent DNA helicase RecG
MKYNQNMSKAENNNESILTLPISTFPLIGSSYAIKLERMGIVTVDDLLHHYPFRYDDLSLTTSIESLKEGEAVTLTGTIISIKSIRTRTGKTMQQAVFSDGSGLLKINWFNQPFLVQTFRKHAQVSLSGKVKIFAGKPTLSSPQYEPLKTSVSEDISTIHTGRLVPVYPETAGVSSKWLRSRINSLLKILPPQSEILPATIVSDLPALDWSIRNIHFPGSLIDTQKARQRLAFDELLTWQLVAQTRKRTWNTQKNPWDISQVDLAPYLKKLPFSLSDDQQKCIRDILDDLHKSHPMNRLLQGDVGSGKTVVAGAIMYLLAKQGMRSALMAPTEILASQHFETLTKVLGTHNITIALATRTHKDDLTIADVVVGTHALLHRELPQNLALLVIDEQHRFGVTQRSQLLHLPKTPHLLSMTATPIPRTIALTLYAELDVSVIKEMPIGRTVVKTWVVHENKREGAYTWIKQQVHEGGQAFIVCPLIEQSENMTDVKAVEVEFNRLQKDIFPDLKLGLVHGKLKSPIKDAVITAFSLKEIDILVATSVIEVGIDIKNATIMVIEGAERFGLAQLHQLRGRVGRSNKQSYCLLFPTTDEAGRNRLKYLETIHSGFELAEIDLKLRGPGNVYGQQQSGFIDLKLASFNDIDLINMTHQKAVELLKLDPKLNSSPKLKIKLDKIIKNLADPN